MLELLGLVCWEGFNINYQLSINDYQLNEPLSKHTTFKVGGLADVFVTPQNENQLATVLADCQTNGYDFLVLGNGSNLLVGDGGFRGVVISLLGLNKIKLVSDDTIHAEAGASMKDLAEFAQSHGITGFEFAHGIPGSVGGGVYMNAGAYEGEMKDIFLSARCINPTGDFVDVNADQMNLAYRKSSAQSQGLIIATSLFRGKVGDKGQITTKMIDLQTRREEKQPLEMPSAGSTFKRPEGHFAGKLIMDAGLRGYAIGGAQVSEKHCGFIVNKGGATAKDILDLISHVQNVVQEKFGILLETEVKIVGDKNDNNQT
ncbi:MAG: UDP-N-acetylmuramate dehydrogenase [Defluviitaleaceae bacterium]|nr:UDP-N-acetylmuramate dehydrogenase [Defluviitaleaceae bacterium]